MCIISSDHQWMAVGANGRHRNPAVWRVEGDTGHVLAHVPIQRQNGTERIALGQISPQRAVICTIVKVVVWNSKTSMSRYTNNAFMTWIVSSNNQWMEVGASGRHGNHAAWRVEVETGHVLARALIQRQNGTDWIALGQISPQRAVIYTIFVKVGLWNSKMVTVYTLSKLLCHGLFLLIISEWKLEPVVVMAIMQRDVWRWKQDTYSHVL